MCECGFCTGPCVHWGHETGEEEKDVTLPLRVRLCDDALDHTMWAWIVRLFANGSVYVRAVANINGCLGWYLFKSLVDATRATFALMHTSFPARFEKNVDLLWIFKTTSGIRSVRDLRRLKTHVSIPETYAWEREVSLEVMRCRATIPALSGPMTRSRIGSSPAPPAASETSPLVALPSPPSSSKLVESSKALLSTFEPPVANATATTTPALDRLMEEPPVSSSPMPQPSSSVIRRTARGTGKPPGTKRKRLVARDSGGTSGTGTSVVRGTTSSSSRSLPASPKHSHPSNKITPYPVESIGTNDDIANILRTAQMPWSNDTIVELLSNAARIPLVHVASIECNRYGLIECSFGLPNGVVVNHVWVQLNLMTYHYMDQVKHLLHTKMA